MKEIPALDQLAALRKGLGKVRPPHVVDGMWCSEPGIGGAKFTASGDDFVVQWVIFRNGLKSELKTAKWSELCSEPSYESLRLELGWVIAEYMEFDAKRVMEAAGHPVGGMREATSIRRMSEEWRAWALAPAFPSA